jgi:AcrR family transcriptional regulator
MSDQPIQSLRGEHSEATRRALIGSAREAFGAIGYQEAGIESVARAARVSRGALYHHFRDKKALFEAVVLEAQSEAAAEIDNRARGVREPWDQLVAGVEAYLEICQRPQYRRIVIEDAPAALGKARCAEIDDAYPMDVLRAKLSALQDAGLISNVNASVLSSLLGAMICEGAALLSTRAKRADVTPDRVHAVLHTFLEAFRPV